MARDVVKTAMKLVRLVFGRDENRQALSRIAPHPAPVRCHSNSELQRQQALACASVAIEKRYTAGRDQIRHEPLAFWYPLAI